MKNFTRIYTLASLALMILSAVAILFVYRAVMTRGITAITESSSEATAQFALHPIRAVVADYVTAASEPGRDPNTVELPSALRDAIAELVRDSHVEKVKIYSSDGRVLFSTNPGEIGSAQASNPGVVDALSGRVSVQLVYRDTWNLFDNVMEDANQVQTYFPVRAFPTGPVLGVFETYTDVNELVIEAQKSELQVTVVTLLILALVYLALLLLVYHAHGLIEEGEKTIRDKNALLEQLSRESLLREESERKKLATELHEGLAQSLSAVKVSLERVSEGASTRSGAALQSVIPELQSAIGQLSIIATELRPMALDELGLAASINALCRRVEASNPRIRVERQIDAADFPVPEALKIVVYRAVETVLQIAADNPRTRVVRIALETSSHALTLDLEDDAMAVVGAMKDEEGMLDPHSPFERVRERVIRSGGRLSVVSNDSGQSFVRASWLM